MGPGALAPTGVLKTTTVLIPFPLWSDLASMLGSPSSDWAARPLSRSFFPALEIGAGPVWTTARPGENASDHFTPFDAVNASGFVMFSTRTVNFVALSPFPDAVPAMPKKAPTATANVFVNTFRSSFYDLQLFSVESLKRDL